VQVASRQVPNTVELAHSNHRAEQSLVVATHTHWWPNQLGDVHYLQYHACDCETEPYTWTGQVA